MIVKAADPEEYAETYEVVDKAFKQSKIEKTIIRITINEDPNFQKGDLRVAKVDGKIVSMALIIRRNLRIGVTIVNGAIVAPVATHPDYRRKGYCSAVMRDAIQYMKTQDFDMTILWGIPWLYPHYGYSPAMVNYELAIKTRGKEHNEKSFYTFRSFAENDLGDLSRIYHNNTLTKTLAELRSPTMWEWKPGGSEAKLEVIIDNKGKIIGYCSLGTDWGRPCSHEVGVSNDEACEVIFNSFVKCTKEKNLKEFICIIHPDHPFTNYAFYHGGELRIRSGGGAGMARVLNLVSLLSKMKKEFEYRLQHSELHDLVGTLKIVSEETIILQINHEKITTTNESINVDYQLDIPLKHVNPLITGYKTLDELIKDPIIKVKGGKKARRLLGVLFPKRFPSGGFLPIVWE